ncbi:MAG TPA: DNA gyrase inhibitor YacG [Terriglobales bacterium]|jgi:endogenous inhibitor of DNA gyrase (YacG/DUF329 family)
MPRKRSPKLSCPTCKKPVNKSNEDFPFCSDRCRLIDLGKWASGEYVISSPVTDIEDEVDFRPRVDSDKKI